MSGLWTPPRTPRTCRCPPSRATSTTPTTPQTPARTRLHLPAPIAAVPASIPATRATAIAINTINTESTGSTDRAESAAAGIDTAAAAPTGAAAPGTATPPDQLAARAASVPALIYPEELPVSARRDEIAEAIRDNQVVIVAGETGSGKTTQLPKICLELGRGVTGMIGHTQPRRIAARSVAERIAHELGTRIGREGIIGYQVRFTEETGPSTLVKLMTDGILLAEIQSDPMLSRYDTIIVDEAHERSLTSTSSWGTSPGSSPAVRI